jgi:thioredoxin-like negative regulator of GroEL
LTLNWILSRIPSGDTRERTRARGLSFLLGILLLASPASATPFRPTDDTQALEYLPIARDASLRELRRLHADLARAPEDLALALRVASADIDAARTQADPRYNGYAEAALAPWLALASLPPAVLVLRATLRQSRHDFAGALTDLSSVLAADPRNAQARLTRAVILQVQGAYDEALGNCLSLGLLAEPLVTETCVASVRSLHGMATASREGLQAALDRAPPAKNGQVRLWALTVLAETDARLGDSQAAERHFREALSLGLRDSYLLGAYADFLLDAGRPGEVRALLQDEGRIDPLLLRIALAEQAMGAPTLRSHIADLSERFAANRRRGDTSHQREEARFALSLLKDPQEALLLAQANWAQQREPWDARVLLAAALAAEKPETARPVLDWLATSHLEDDEVRGLAAKLAQATP